MSWPSLTTPDGRRALRAIIAAIAELALVAMVWVYTAQLRGTLLASVVHSALFIIGLAVLLYGAENVTRAVTFAWSAKGVSGSIGGEAEAAQAVAAAATDKADEITGSIPTGGE